MVKKLFFVQFKANKLNIFELSNRKSLV